MNPLKAVHIRIKRGIIQPPAGYTAILKAGEPIEPSITKKRLDNVESPLISFAKQFAEKHHEVGYLSDGRLSQDSYNFAGLKIQYLKKGLSENQADLQAKRDVVKNLEIRSMELDLIQSQALKIGIPSFQPKTHLELITSLAEKINNRKREFLYVEKREILESSLRLKAQYNDISPLQFSQISTFTPREYFTFIREHPEYQKVLLLPVIEEKTAASSPQPQEEEALDINSLATSAEFDEDYEHDEEDKRADAVQELLGNDVNLGTENVGYKPYDYYLVPENLYFNPPDNIRPELLDKPGLNEYVPEDNELEIEKETDEDQQDQLDSTNNIDNIETDIMGFKERDLELENYEQQMDETRLEDEDFCVTLTDLENIPSEIERTDLIKNQLKKNFFSKDSLDSSKIAIESDRFVSKDKGNFPSVSDFTFTRYARYPTVSAIKTLKHLFLQNQISDELHQYLERQDGVGIQERVSQNFNIQMNYLNSDLSNIESIEQLAKYNQDIAASSTNAKDLEFKELYINTVLGVTDSLYLNPINEQKVLKKKYGSDFIFEEEVIERSEEQEKKDLLNKIRVEDIDSMKGPVFGEDGSIDLKKTNIYSPNQLYESTVSNMYKQKLENQIKKENGTLNNNKDESEAPVESFQDFVSNEVDEIIKGGSSIDPTYLLDANDNRNLLNNNNINNNIIDNTDNTSDNKNNIYNNYIGEINKNEEPRKKTSFRSFFEKYIVPKDINEYAEYYKDEIVSNADQARMKAQGLTENIGKREERHNEIKELARDAQDPDDVALAREYLQKEISVKEGSSTPELDEASIKWIEHQKLYPEFYSGKNISTLIKNREIDEELISAYISDESSDRKFNAAPSFNQEDKVDFRTLKLDAQTEAKYAKEIKEFREKDARGEITDTDSYEFTNYINFLKEKDAIAPLVQKVRSKLFFKDYRNEMIDSYNQELLSSLEDDNTGSVEEISALENNLKQLGEMIPEDDLREMTINSLLSPYYNPNVTSELDQKLKEYNLEKRFSKKN